MLIMLMLRWSGRAMGTWSAVIGAAALMAVLATVARAEDETAAGTPIADSSAGNGPLPITDTEPLFRSLDADGDGLVTEDEIDAKHARLFRRLIRTADSNNDDAIDLAELTAGLEPDRPQRPVEQLPPKVDPADEPGAVFARMDRNKDGLLTEAETPAEGRGLWTRFFENADRSGDGKLNVGEFMRNYYRIARFTRDDAGQAADRAAGMFRRLDANGDGQLEPSEIPEERRQRFARLMARADENYDGTLDRKELASAMAGLQRMTSMAKQRDDRAGEMPAAEKGEDISEEVVELIRRAMRLDTSGDGRLDEKEARGPLLRYFSRVDLDGNGELDEHELKMMAQIRIERKRIYRDREKSKD